MDDIPPAKRPKISENPRLFKKKPHAQSRKDKGKQAVRTRNAGKLATLMDITLDVFFEIITHLRPIDLLQLCRVSKHFRKTFMSKSVRTLWVATRRNADVLPAPEPLPWMSEPCFASLLFERTCFACGVGRAANTDFALGYRFCAACAKVNFKSVHNLRRLANNGDLPDIIIQLIPTSSDCRDTAELPESVADLRRKLSNCYVPEFDIVKKEYRKAFFEGPQVLDNYVTRRREYVASNAKHAQAISKWSQDCKEIHASKANEVQSSRETCIKDKLRALGYIDEDFPQPIDQFCPAWNAWQLVVDQPRELTNRIWKNIQPKLEKAIEECRAWRIERAAAQRRIRRNSELRQRYNAWTLELDVDDGPYPTLDELCSSPEMDTIILEDDIRLPIDQGRFDAVVLPVLQRYKITARASLVKALRPIACNSTEDGSSEDILYRATSLFANPIPATSIVWQIRMKHKPKLFSFRELLVEMHAACKDTERGQNWPKAVYKLGNGAETAQAVLRAVGLSDETPYDKVTRRVVCLCNRPDFHQPASFAQLVCHIMKERECHHQMQEAISKLQQEGDAIEGLAYDYLDDHEPNSESKFLKLLAEGEEYAASDTAGSSDVQDVDFRCKICKQLSEGGRESVTTTSLAPRMPLKVLKWHVQAKHYKEYDKDDAECVVRSWMY